MSDQPFPELPLIVGRQGVSESPLPVESSRGLLIVAGEARERDGLTVQRCLCGCSRRECGQEADVDTRYLNDPQNFKSDVCPFRGRAFFPPLADVMAAAAKRGVKSTDQYREAFTRGFLPKGSPRNPAEYEEWTSWADFTGVEDYHSNQELFDGLLALDLDSLGLLPRPDRRRFLLASRYWSGIKQKAKELKIEEKDIPDRLAEIVAALGGNQQTYPQTSISEESSGGGGGGKRSGGRTKVPERLSLAQEGGVLVNSVTLWLPNSRELQQETINGFFHSVWEMLDREDTLRGNGIEAVTENVLKPLEPVKPDLVAEFLRQYDGARKFLVNNRNWMQAYSLFYAHEHRKFINWSAAGRGKARTFPAIVTEFDIHFTILFSPKKITNKDNPQLQMEIDVEDPNGVLHYSDNGVPEYLAPDKHHYFVCNSEKLQQGKKTRAMVDALMLHKQGLVVFDEAHLLVSSNLVDQSLGEGADAKFKPRMEGLRYLLDKLPADIRVVLLTGTPVRVDAREGQALFELIGEDVGEYTPEMSEMNALRLRGRLQNFGFAFSNHRLPELRRFVCPFRVPDEIANDLNSPGLSTLDKEKIRIELALKEIYSLSGRAVINAERVGLPSADGAEVDDTSVIEKEIGIDLSALSKKRFPVVRLGYEPLSRAVNPVFFTYFVDGPAEVIAKDLDERGIRYRRCTGDSDDAELGAYLKEKDSSLIASSSWSVGVDGSQRVSNALVTLAIPWHDSGHRQTVARVHRQGAMTPDGTPTTVVHEIIPVAVNVAYDVKRLNRVFSRRSFTEVLSLGDIDTSDESEDFTEAVNSLLQQQ